MIFQLSATYNDDGILDEQYKEICINNIDELLELCDYYDEEIIIRKHKSGWILEIYNGYRE
jgi:hypothetical protein